MSRNIEPGDLCIIIGELPGCEENIGAMITVTEKDADGHWLFKDASRPIKMVSTEEPRIDSRLVWSSYEHPIFYAAMKAEHLVPIRPGDDLEICIEEAPTPEQVH